MKKQFADFRFKTWHFILLFFLLVVLINLMGKQDVKQDILLNGSYLPELDLNSFKDSVSTGVCYVLFYTQNSTFCNKMESNLSQIKEDVREARFYKMNIDNNIVIGEHISGVPTILIYKDGKEIERIMGLVPTSNLKMINKKIGG